MKYRAFAAGILAVVLLLCLSGCTRVPANTADDSILGTWEDAYGLTEFEFRPDGKMKIKAMDIGTLSGTYTLEGDKLTMEYSMVVKTVKDDYTCRLEDGKLYLGDETFTRKTK